MVMPPMKVSLSDSTTQNPINNGQSITPMQFSTPWNQIKNYSSHSSGASQSGAATANPTTGDTGGMPTYMWAGVALIAYLLLR